MAGACPRAGRLATGGRFSGPRPRSSFRTCCRYPPRLPLCLSKFQQGIETMTTANDQPTPRFVEIARRLGPSFARRAAQHDSEGSFVSENYAQLKEQRLLSAGVPSELGGGGASHA